MPKTQRGCTGWDASFILDRLDYMKRVGGAARSQHWEQTSSKLKPCIEVKDGKMSVGKKYRGNFERVIEQYTADRLQDYCGTNGTAIVAHPAAPAEAVAAACRVLEQDGRFEQIIVARAGCTVACHCGPNTVGVMFLKIHNRRFVIRASGTAENCCAACFLMKKGKIFRAKKGLDLKFLFGYL